MFLSNQNMYNMNFKVAMYIRISREDGDKLESESISNQREILKRYIEENKLTFFNEYIDDGVSGTTFDRVGFNKMLGDIEERKGQYGYNKRLIKTSAEIILKLDIILKITFQKIILGMCQY